MKVFDTTNIEYINIVIQNNKASRFNGISHTICEMISYNLSLNKHLGYLHTKFSIITKFYYGRYIYYSSKQYTRASTFTGGDPGIKIQMQTMNHACPVNEMLGSLVTMQVTVPLRYLLNLV